MTKFYLNRQKHNITVSLKIPQVVYHIINQTDQFTSISMYLKLKNGVGSGTEHMFTMVYKNNNIIQRIYCYFRFLLLFTKTNKRNKKFQFPKLAINNNLVALNVMRHLVEGKIKEV